jgi:prepilin-type N-terminal cleavage/methylation domain-containing protein
MITGCGKMAKLSDNKGFSLAETLIALGILAVGMLLIAGVFPVAIQLITISAERTTAAVVAEEAFAKVQLYGSGGINFSKLQQNQLKDFNDFDDITDPVLLPVGNPPTTPDVGKYEFTYPSTVSSNVDIMQKQYCWSALCRATAGNNSPVQVTVFVCRKAGRNSRYYEPGNGGNINWPTPNETDWPRPVKINVSQEGSSNNLLRITGVNATNEKNLINDDYTIVDDQTGLIYRVVRRLPAGSTAVPSPADEVIQLDRDWPTGSTPGPIWVVPPAVGGGRNPCIAVYQKEILF